MQSPRVGERRLRRPSNLWYLLVVGVAAASLVMLAGLRPAAADHTPLCTDPLALDAAGESCWIHPAGITSATTGVAGSYTIEVWGAGGGGGLGVEAGGGGGGGGAGDYATATINLDAGTALTAAVGDGPAASTAGDGTSVTVDGLTIGAAGGGFGGAGSEGSGGVAGAGGGGNGTTTIPTVAAPVTAASTTTGGSGTAGAPPAEGTPGAGGDGGANSALLSGAGGVGGTVDAAATAGEHPAGGGGGGRAAAGALGGDGAVRITLVSVAPDPTIEKTGEFDALTGIVTFTVTVSNTFGLDVGILLHDVIELPEGLPTGSADVTVGVGCTELEAEVDETLATAELLLDCVVPAAVIGTPGELVFTITVDVGLCNIDPVINNDVSLFRLVDVLLDLDVDIEGLDLEAFAGITLLPLDTAEAEVDLVACWEPEIEKFGIEVDGPEGFFWEIIINNDPPGDAVAVNTEVSFTDPDVELLGFLADGDQCGQVGTTITCDVAADDEIRIIVHRDGPDELTCESQFDDNSITSASALFDLTDDDTINPVAGPVTLLDLPTDVESEVSRGEGACIDNPEDFFPPHDATATPTATPTVTPTPPADTCDVPDATWSTTPVVPGLTIAIWGGGNLSEFPLPIATSYWTTVNGQWYGYVPGAPAFVNARFLAQYPGGNIPDCTGFVIAHWP